MYILKTRISNMQVLLSDCSNPNTKDNEALNMHSILVYSMVDSLHLQEHLNELATRILHDRVSKTSTCIRFKSFKCYYF